MVALVSCILKKPDLDEEDLGEDLDKVMSPNATSTANSTEPVSLTGELSPLPQIHHHGLHSFGA